ncbi:MAG: recombinase RecT, partial [Colwellia sp.]|nr:recombinase RecT [Colwellia sp.]
CYCTVKLPSGDFLTEEMDRIELDKIREASATKKDGNNPWTKWPEEMMRKSVVKRAAKYWPVSERMATATEYLNQTQGNEEIIINELPEAEFITEEQSNTIDELIRIKKANLERFLFCLKVPSINEITTKDYDHAVRMLKQKR